MQKETDAEKRKGRNNIQKGRERQKETVRKDKR